MMKISFFLLMFLPLASVAGEFHEYRPGGEEWADAWSRFYSGDHEPELDDPLIEAGPDMTLVICEAVSNRDMRLRRYALSALGWIGDKRAIPTLTDIATSEEEIYYFRGDALEAIYLLDRQLAKELARSHGADHRYLREVARRIEHDDSSLVEPSSH